MSNLTKMNYFASNSAPDSLILIVSIDGEHRSSTEAYTGSTINVTAVAHDPDDSVSNLTLTWDSNGVEYYSVDYRQQYKILVKSYNTGPLRYRS